MDGRSLACVEHAHLDQGLVCRKAHFSAHGVDLPNQVPLSRTAYGRVAGHHADAVQIHGEQGRIQPHAGQSQCRLYATVAGPYHHGRKDAALHGGRRINVCHISSPARSERLYSQ